VLPPWKFKKLKTGEDVVEKVGLFEELLTIPVPVIVKEKPERLKE
jgi:hypothetical protein